MKIGVFAVYDSKTGIYAQPNFLINKGAALRAWEDAANDQNSNIGKHPGDYTMFQIAEWDDESGTITMLPAKINLGNALEFVGRHDSSMTRMSNFNSLGNDDQYATSPMGEDKQ